MTVETVQRSQGPQIVYGFHYLGEMNDGGVPVDVWSLTLVGHEITVPSMPIAKTSLEVVHNQIILELESKMYYKRQWFEIIRNFNKARA